MKDLSLDDIINGMNMNRRQSNIRESKKELKRRGYSANYDSYRDVWYLC